jgi:hypothetical protein
MIAAGLLALAARAQPADPRAVEVDAAFRAGALSVMAFERDAAGTVRGVTRTGDDGRQWWRADRAP